VGSTETPEFPFPAGKVFAGETHQTTVCIIHIVIEIDLPCVVDDENACASTAQMLGSLKRPSLRHDPILAWSHIANEDTPNALQSCHLLTP